MPGLQSFPDAMVLVYDGSALVAAGLWIDFNNFYPNIFAPPKGDGTASCYGCSLEWSCCFNDVCRHHRAEFDFLHAIGFHYSPRTEKIARRYAESMQLVAVTMTCANCLARGPTSCLAIGRC